MMIGAVVAVLYFNTKHRVFRFKFQHIFDMIFHKYAQVFLIILFWVFTFLHVAYELPQGDVPIAILAAILIANLCETSTSIYSLSNNKFQFIGRISYGIYLLHKIPMFLVLYLVEKYMTGQSLVLQNVAIYSCTLIAIIGLASASYYGYERYFLLFKQKFQKVKSNQI